MHDDNVKNKIKIQQLIDNNTVRAGGDFHEDGLDSDSFVSDIDVNFKLTPKKSGANVSKLLDDIIKSSSVKVVGRFNTKTFRQNVFIKKLFDNFEIKKL